MTVTTKKYTQEYCDFVNALREFERAHERWMNCSIFSPEGEAAKQYKNSCLARYTQARRVWENKKRADDQRGEP